MRRDCSVAVRSGAVTLAWATRGHSSTPVGLDSTLLGQALDRERRAETPWPFSRPTAAGAPQIVTARVVDDAYRQARAACGDRCNL